MLVNSHLKQTMNAMYLQSVCLFVIEHVHFVWHYVLQLRLTMYTFRPDITVMVDWALKSNNQSINHFQSWSQFLSFHIIEYFYFQFFSFRLFFSSVFNISVFFYVRLPFFIFFLFVVWNYGNIYIQKDLCAVLKDVSIIQGCEGD